MLVEIVAHIPHFIKLYLFITYKTRKNESELIMK